MRQLPYLTYMGNARPRVIGTFKGLNKNLVVSGNEFSDMKNISPRFYPAIGTRLPRGEILDTITNANGLYHKNGLFWISGTQAFYKGNQVGTVTAGQKQLAGMGAYIIIFPDKIAFNTYSGSWNQMAVNFTPSGNITFAPLTEGSAFTKITATGIHQQFNKNDGVQISGCSDAQFNTTKIITEIGTNYIVVTGAITTSFTNTGIRFSRNVPDMDFICEANNRLWGCSSAAHEIYGSKLGDPLNFNCFEGISTDSYAASIGTDGDFTGICSHLGYVLFFKENAIHKMFGNKPSSFQLNSYNMPGVMAGCDRSVKVVDETLYFVGRNGVYAYDGSTPICISKCFGDMRLSDAIASQQNSKYYVSANDGSGYRMYVYDTKNDIWDIEDELRFRQECYGDGTLYYIDTDGNLSTITGDREEDLEWFLESGDIVDETIEHKYISKLEFNFWLDRKSAVNVYVKWDDEKIWERKGTISTEWNRTYTLPIIPQRCQKFRFRLEGKGAFKLLGIGRYIEGGSEVLHGIAHH